MVKRLKVVQSMNDAKKKAVAIGEIETQIEEPETNHLCVGRRIVEVSELGENLICCQCTQVLSLKNVVQEKRLGLNSILHVFCQNCFILTEVPMGKMHCGKKNVEFSDVNTKAVLDTPRIPMILSIQLAFLCASIFSMIINMMYSASLISSLTVHYYTPPFISLEGLLNDGSYKFGINAISAEYAVHYHPTNPFLIKLKEAVMEKSATKLPRTYIEGLTRVCNNNNYAFMANDEILEELRPQLKCEFFTLPKDIYQVNTAYVMAKNNPYITVINYKLIWMIETGITQRLTNIIKPKKRTFTNSQSWRSVELEDMYLLYIILGTAINIAFLILLMEMIIHRYRKWKTI